MNGQRFFRRLIRLFPAEFRGDFGDEMLDTFEAQRRDVLARGDAMAALRLWWDTVRGVLDHRAARASRSFALRRELRRQESSAQPGFAVTAIAALAIGIGANTAVFTIVNGALLAALPYRDPQRLVLLFEKVPGAPFDKFDFSAPDFEIVRDLARSYDGMAAYRNAGYELSGIAQPERLTGARVSPNLFGVLGVAPALGRALTEEEDRQHANVTVLTDGLWSRAFGRDPSILGRTITLDRQPYTVVGVMPPSFQFPPHGAESNGTPAALFVPIAFSPLERAEFGDMYNNTVVARLKAGVTYCEARAELPASGACSPIGTRPSLHAVAAKLLDSACAVQRRSGRPKPPHAARADGRCWHRAADRLRRCGQPDVDARRKSRKRELAIRYRGRRQPGASRPAAAHGRLRARNDWRRRRSPARVLVDARAPFIRGRRAAAHRIDCHRLRGSFYSRRRCRC